ncbi:restriction endonuclease subunit S [Algoriphagus marincola]|uniref:Restriction endonuclease subunit S n=1 Tax=Algoriphagus marincola TaxID=264027 RepID=A0ABS7N121_9BACT|nr:restriction endonuclease subunit S [Algoriphagus marincola]MBY5950026.1 restriction endonuclease subunit S [Algoriphagus marincola]
MKKIGRHSFPDHWDIHPLTDVLFLQEGPGIRKKEYQDDGYPMINVRCVQDGYIDMSKARAANMELATSKWAHFQIDENDILFTISGTIGRCAIVKKRDLPLLMNTSVVRFKPIHPHLTLSFAYQYLRSDFFVDMLKDMSTGTAIQNVGPSHLKKLFVPIPPLPEQQRIVSILDRAFAAIDKAKANAEQNLFNVNELFENSAQEIFTRKGIDWEEKLLGDFAEFRNGINYTKGSKGEKIKIVGVKDFQDNYWVPENDLVEVSLDGSVNETDLLKEGDILAVRSNGNPQLIGRTLLAGLINEKISHSGFTIRIRLKSKIVNPNYLCHFMKIQETRKTLVESGNGVGIKSLNQGSLSSLKIPFPKSLKEQEMIIEKVDSLAEQSQRLKEIYQRKINDLKELKKSILQKAFAGELETETLKTV